MMEDHVRTGDVESFTSTLVSLVGVGPSMELLLKSLALLEDKQKEQKVDEAQEEVKNETTNEDKGDRGDKQQAIPMSYPQCNLSLLFFLSTLITITHSPHSHSLSPHSHLTLTSLSPHSHLTLFTHTLFTSLIPHSHHSHLIHTTFKTHYICPPL